jgi:hypothetical protein
MGTHKSIDFMVAFVKDYLAGENNRLGWDLDFNHYMIEHFPNMERENPYVADCFALYISEQGFDHGEHMNDVEHKKLIRRQFIKFSDAITDGFG